LQQSFHHINFPAAGIIHEHRAAAVEQLDGIRTTIQEGIEDVDRSRKREE